MHVSPKNAQHSWMCDRMRYCGGGPPGVCEPIVLQADVCEGQHGSVHRCFRVITLVVAESDTVPDWLASRRTGPTEETTFSRSYERRSRVLGSPGPLLWVVGKRDSV